jgi:uncharacterized repeat protein (TIGR03803 family)
MRQIGLPCSVSILLALCVATAPAAPAQTFTTLASFDGKDGDYPYGPLVQGTDGNFYGTTSGGGAGGQCSQSGGCGTVFRITPTGTLTTLYNFCSKPSCTDGYWPYAGLVQGTDGNFYGTTLLGGANAVGTFFKITSKGALTTLYNFCSQPNCTDGDRPFAGVVQASNGNFYGTTAHGGTGAQSSGTVFKVTAKGKLTTLYNFCSQPNCADGQEPLAALVQATDGSFYGTTQYGGTGSDQSGTAFKITSYGAFTTLYSFCSQPNCSDGAFPNAPLVQGADGNFYGTTEGSGGDFYGRTQGNGLAGTVYRIAPGGTITTLYAFCSQPNCADGEYPVGGLAQATDGNFYGTTSDVGTGRAGTIFEITPGGTLTTLYAFCSQPNCTDGAVPFDGPVQGTDGTFYGLTSGGGIVSCDPNNPGCGTAFSLSVGLGPFVETRPTSGKIEKKVIILGNKLTGASAVEFNGTPATFSVVSATEIKTKVPAGATTGFVTVTTPKGTLTSNIQFVVP